jgi:hypothetical protein
MKSIASIGPKILPYGPGMAHTWRLRGSDMKVQELIGSRAWVKEANGPEHEGYISSVPKPVEAENIEAAISASTFRIEFPSGGVVETSGMWISRIDNADYVRESGKSAG